MGEKEQHTEGLPLTGIHINLEEHTIELEDQHGTVAKLVFPPFGTIYFQGGSLEVVPSPPTAPVERPHEPEKEAPKTVTLTGRLKNQPREGKPDRSGNPTAYARFAAHVEGEREAHDYIATFHRHTAKIAMGLARDAQITAEGYVHPSNSDKRLDTFSVVNLAESMGKRARQR